MYRFLPLLIASGLVSQAQAVCQSFGTDFQQDGTYCIDPRSTDYFSFGTQWFGCTADDTQGGISPFLVDPNTDDYFCSDIQTNPDGQEMISTCNTPGEELRKSQMVSGNWSIGLYGLTFAYTRQFRINVQTPVVVTSTPTVSFTITSTPSTTSTSTITGTDSVTLTAKTTTVPSTTVTHTITKTPARVTTTSTSTWFLTLTKYTWAKTTVTSTTTCHGKDPRQDPTATHIPSRVASSLAAASATGGSRARRDRAGWGNEKLWGRKAAPEPQNPNNVLAKRTPDLCTTTTIASTAISTTFTSLAPVTTIVVPTATTITVTITPPVVTSLSGKAQTTITTTLPTPTRTITRYTLANITTTKTILATVTARVTVAPSGKVCR